MDDDISLGLIIGILLTISVVGAIPETIKPFTIQLAFDVCENNGGVRYIELDFLESPPDVVCKNGAEFQDYTKLAIKRALK